VSVKGPGTAGHLDSREQYSASLATGSHTLDSTMKRPTLTLVIPIFNEEAVIPELERRLKSTLASIQGAIDDWEVVFVDDGSSDASPSLIRAMCALERRFKLVAFARNFGHQMAITAGLDVAEGEAVVVMDADLQDPPEVIAAMLAKWREGWDVVYAVRENRRGETAFKRVTAAIFYRLLRAMLGGFSLPLDTGDFRLIARPVVLAIRALREQHRFVRGMVSWLGFRQTAVHYERQGRFAGETKFPVRKMLRFAIDGITSFSIVPLRFATLLGTFAGLVAMLAAAWSVYEKFYARGVVQGWTTIMLAVALGSSAQLLMIGILGEYVGRIYEEVKRRPLYVAIDRINLGDDPDP
jgi:glycosyltransferase involved in cell wall biosynthesis